MAPSHRHDRLRHEVPAAEDEADVLLLRGAEQRRGDRVIRRGLGVRDGRPQERQLQIAELGPVDHVRAQVDIELVSVRLMLSTASSLSQPLSRCTASGRSFNSPQHGHRRAVDAAAHADDAVVFSIRTFALDPSDEVRESPLALTRRRQLLREPSERSGAEPAAAVGVELMPGSDVFMTHLVQIRYRRSPADFVTDSDTLVPAVLRVCDQHRATTSVEHEHAASSHRHRGRCPEAPSGHRRPKRPLHRRRPGS